MPSNVYNDAINVVNQRANELRAVLDNENRTDSELVNASGRYVASLQTLRVIAIRENVDMKNIYSALTVATNRHQEYLQRADINNRKSDNYSVITEMSNGFRQLVNSVRLREQAQTKEEKRDANARIIQKIGKNLKNIVKAPLVVGTRVLSSSLLIGILLAPISISLGILSTVFSAIDDTKGNNPFDGKAPKLSNGLTNAMKNLNNKVKKV